MQPTIAIFSEEKFEYFSCLLVVYWKSLKSP